MENVDQAFDTNQPSVKKKHSFLKIVVVIFIVGGLYNLITGNSGGGIYNPKYQNGVATIKVDDYTFDGNSDPDWWKLCEKFIEASKHKGVQEIHLALVVTWKDTYGKETKQTIDIRMDDPSVRPINEIAKFQDGNSLYDRYGLGFVAAYVLAKRSAS